MDTEQQDELKPPYLPFQTFLGFLSELSTKPLPPQIDRSMMNSKSGTDQANLFAALKFFGLIDQKQTVMDDLKRLTSTDENGRKAGVGMLLRQKYPRQFEVSEQNGTEKLLLDSIGEDFGYTGDTSRKAMTFFLHGARWAGIDLSPHFPTTRMGSGRSATPRAKRTVKKKASTAGATNTPKVTPRGPDGSGERIAVSLGAAGSVSVEVNVRWLDLTDDTFTNLRRIVKELQELGAPDDEAVDDEDEEEVSTS